MKRALAIPMAALAISTFSPAPFAQQAAPAQPARSVWDGIYTAAQAERGAALYEAECMRCHGLDLRGGEMAPGVVGGDFRWNWNGLSVGQLFERLRVTMPLDGPERMTRDEKADVLAFMLNVNEYPAGATELQGRKEVLDLIRFEAIRN